MIRGNIYGNVSNFGNNNSGIIGDEIRIGSMHSGHTTTTNSNNTTTTVGNVTAGGGGNGANNGGAGGSIGLTFNPGKSSGSTRAAESNGEEAIKIKDMKSGSGGKGGGGEVEGGGGGAGGSAHLNMSQDVNCDIGSVAAGDGGEGGGGHRGGQGGRGGDTTLDQH